MTQGQPWKHTNVRERTEGEDSAKVTEKDHSCRKEARECGSREVKGESLGGTMVNLAKCWKRVSKKWSPVLATCSWVAWAEGWKWLSSGREKIEGEEVHALSMDSSFDTCSCKGEPERAKQFVRGRFSLPKMEASVVLCIFYGISAKTF